MDARVSDEMQVVIELKNGRPVELLDFANSMVAFGRQYAHYLEEAGSEGAVPDAKLYIREIRQGSIIATLGALAPVVVPMFDQINVVWNFAEDFAGMVSWLLKRDGDRPQFDKETLQNISKFVKPVAEDRSAQLNIGSLQNHGEIHLHLSIDSPQANAVQNAVNRELEAMKVSVAGLKSAVALHWEQASNTQKSRPGDKARIDSLYDGPVKVKFEDENLKRAMLLDDGNPFKKAFIVDVFVESVGPRPVLYKVLALHDVVDME